MAMNAYLKFVKKMWYAPLVWAGAIIVLVFRFLWSLLRSGDFWPSNRAAKIIYPVDGLKHRFLAGANRVRLHTVTTGDVDKPLMLLLHGFPELWTMWEHQMSAFRDKYNVAAIDMRGYGRSDRPVARQDYYIDVLVEDVIAVVHALGYKKCVLAGHDWGGKVAWTVAHMHQDIIERLVIISAPHPTSWSENFSLRQAIKSSYFQLFYAPWLAELFALHNDVSLVDMALLYPNEHAPMHPEAIPRQEIDLIKDSMCQGINEPTGISSISAMLNYYRGWVDNETWCPIAAVDEACSQMLKVPTMLLVGDSDKYFWPEMWQHLDRHVQNCWLPQAWHMLQNCSHWCPQDCPAAVNAHIRIFLNSNVDDFQADARAHGA